jgi:hypothetical protein
VAIAVALMPPLCAMGFGLGSGVNTHIMGGAGLLFLTNLVAIVSSAFAVFLLVGMSSPVIRSEMEESRKGERFAEKLSRGPLGRVLANSGQLRWRILMLAVLLAVIAVPLRTALMQVASETLIRGVVQDVVKQLLPPGALVSQQVEVGRESIAVRLISTRDVSNAKLQQAEREIERRSGRRADISVASIASQSELAQLMQKLVAPPPPPAPKPVIASVEQMQQDLLARVTPVVQGVWPPEAPLQDFDLALAPSGIVLNVRYQSLHPLGTIPLDILTRELQEKLGTPTLSLQAQRIPPPSKLTKTTHRKR